MASILGWTRIIFKDDFMAEMRAGSMARLRITVEMMMAQPQLGMPWLTIKRRTR